MSDIITKKRHYINPLKVRGNINYAIEEVRRAMTISSDGKCDLCSSELEKAHIHHIDNCPLNWVIENLILLCPACHTRQRRISGDVKRFANRLSLGYGKLAHAQTREISLKVLKVVVNRSEPELTIKKVKKVRISKNHEKPSKSELEHLRREGIIL